MKSSEIRQRFLDYFNQHQHEVVASSSLVPGNDPTLLFTNAGMVQFKDVFLGMDKRPYNRAVTSQRCVRAGGKHNDLENVGYTARHHTFFEMLGNFSFGDYFKEQAIRFAWGFLTEELGLPEEKLWVTVYKDDDEAADLWLNTMGVSDQRFSRLGKKDNFWAMGDTGPCGPCSEIFYDHGEKVQGGPPGSPDEDGDRYVEIWNLVFMQYDSAADGSVSNLPKPSVDTGMGLERISAVMQGVHNNYEIDSFVGLIKAAADLAGVDDHSNASLRVIADHIRACSFLIADGVLPSNEGRGYVLRRIIRRAIRHGYKLGIKHQSFFHKLVAPLDREMGGAYPELSRNRSHIEKILLTEEERFSETLDKGMKIFEAAIEKSSNQIIPGDIAFKLSDTYGFPLDLTADIARERNMTVDTEGFDRAMDAQRKQSQAASKFGVDLRAGIQTQAKSEFTGYDHLTGKSQVLQLFKGDEEVAGLNAGDEGVVILSATPFYAESGGQVGDAGQLSAGAMRFEVDDTQKFGHGIGHIGVLSEGTLARGDQVDAIVNHERRATTILNHTATHLMHAALRETLGDHVLQKGSLVAPDRLRFDFSHYEAVTAEQLTAIEDRVNQQIRENNAVETRLMNFDDAVGAGAMALFGEKYDDEVRVLNIGQFSVELCGGTHVERAGDIGVFKIISESGVAAGVRRIEALTGAAAFEWMRNVESQLLSVAHLVKASRNNLESKVKTAMERTRELEKEVTRLKKEVASGGGGQDILSRVQKAGDINVLAVRMDGLDAGALRDSVDQFRDKLGTAVVVLGSVEDGKVRLVTGVSKDCVGRVKAGELIGEIARMVGGKGGGRPDMAQAGGNDPEKLDAALASVLSHVQSRL